MRDGVLIYQCATPSACPGGTVQGFTGTHSVPAGSYGMHAGGADPDRSAAHRAERRGDRATSGSSRRRTRTGSYPGNIDDFRFAAPVENTFRTYIARGDYRLNGSHNFFGRFNKQNDAIDSTPQYPGSAPGRSRTDKNWGGAFGWDSTLGGTW